MTEEAECNYSQQDKGNSYPHLRKVVRIFIVKTRNTSITEDK